MVLHEYRSDKIVEYIKTHPQYRTVAIALSGDAKELMNNDRVKKAYLSE